MNIPIQDVAANPFRNIDRYPINREKVETLKVSIQNTHLWPTIVGRKSGGKVQIAFGHHRLVAAKELRLKEIPIAIEPLDDTAMLKMMADENMQEWGTSAIVEQETVSAVVKAYADGLIELTKVDSKARGSRYAPSFLSGARAADKPYNAETVADFIKWDVTKVKETLQALEMIEEKSIPKTVYEGLSTKEAVAVTREASKAKRTAGPRRDPKADATKVAKAVAAGMRSGTGVKAAPALAYAAIPKPKTPKGLPNAEKFCADLANLLDEVLPTDRIKSVISNCDDIDWRAVRDVAKALRGVADNCELYAKKLDGAGKKESTSNRKELAS